MYFLWQAELNSESVEKLPINTDTAYGKFKDKKLLSGSTGKMEPIPQAFILKQSLIWGLRVISFPPPPPQAFIFKASSK